MVQCSIEEKKGERFQRQQEYTDNKYQLDEYDELKFRVAGYNLQELKLDDVRSLLISEGIAKYMFGLIGEGKEANVYWVETHNGNFQAAKMFRIYATTHKAKFSKTSDRFGIAEVFVSESIKICIICMMRVFLCQNPLIGKNFFT